MKINILLLTQINQYKIKIKIVYNLHKLDKIKKIIFIINLQINLFNKIINKIYKIVYIKLIRTKSIYS